MAPFNENELLSELYNFMLAQKAETEILRRLLLQIISKTSGQDLASVEKTYWEGFESIYKAHISLSPLRDEFDNEQMEKLLNSLKKGL